MAAMLAACGSSSGAGETFAGYGRTAAQVAKALGTCATVDKSSAAVVGCKTADGSVAVILTSEDADVQGLTLAQIKDRGDLGCVVVLDGVILSSDNSSQLADVLGAVPAAFAAEHGGRVTGPTC